VYRIKRHKIMRILYKYKFLYIKDYTEKGFLNPF